jgi:branched-chain amino acid transport system ATP-binding protein
VLLLDEPLAGMGAEETERMLGLLAELKGPRDAGLRPSSPPEGGESARERPVANSPGHAILLVEHDMDAVFRIADTLTVMVNGTVIATGSPDAVRRNRDVQAEYLGGH